MSIRLATTKDIDMVYQMMYHEVKTGNNQFFVPETEDSRHLHVSNQGITLLYEKNNIIGGYLILRKPFQDVDNLARDINFPPENYNLVAHMESLLVTDSFRGQGIGKKLMIQGEHILKQQGFYYLLATVHPENMGSLKTMLSLDYEMIATKEKYGGKIRHIMKKELLSC